jgi:hypothetical protein
MEASLSVSVSVDDLADRVAAKLTKLGVVQKKDASTQTCESAKTLRRRCPISRLLSEESVADLDDRDFMTLRSGRRVYKE